MVILIFGQFNFYKAKSLNKVGEKILSLQLGNKHSLKSLEHIIIWQRGAQEDEVATWAHDNIVREGQHGPRGTMQFGAPWVREMFSKHKKGKRLLILSFYYASMISVF